MGTVDLSLGGCNLRLVGRRAFACPPTWKSSYRGGLLKLKVPRAPDYHDE